MAVAILCVGLGQYAIIVSQCLVTKGCQWLTVKHALAMSSSSALAEACDRARFVCCRPVNRKSTEGVSCQLL